MKGFPTTLEAVITSTSTASENQIRFRTIRFKTTPEMIAAGYHQFFPLEKVVGEKHTYNVKSPNFDPLTADKESLLSFGFKKLEDTEKWDDMYPGAPITVHFK